jgi:hypothetical protein
MNIKPTVKQEAKDLNIRIRGLLPLAYHSCLEAISPTSMGSAGLKYRPARLARSRQFCEECAA